MGAAAGLFDKRVDLRALVLPRRDTAADGPAAAVPGPEAGPDAVAEFGRLVAEARPVLDTAIRHGGSAEDLVEAASAPGCGDLAAMSPRQAAIAAAAVLYDGPMNLRPETLADAWVAARGVPFAAEAAVELAAFAVFVLHTGNDAPALRRGTGLRSFPNERFATIAQVRRHLAAASGDEHGAAWAAVQGLADPADAQSAATAFLFPEHTESADREIRRVRHHRNQSDQELEAWLLFGAVTTGDQAAGLARWVWSDVLRQCPAATATLFATVGTGLVPALEIWSEGNWEVEERQRIQRLLAGLDADEALRALLGMLGERGTAAVLVEAVTRFPERGVRILAAEPPAEPLPRAAAERVLRMHVISNPDVAREVASGLDDEARARVERLLGAAEPLPAADSATLPDILVSPPWEHAREVAKPIVVKGLTPPAETGVLWLDDAERDLWRTDVLESRNHPDMQWDRMVREVRNRFNWHVVALLIVRGPEDGARIALGAAEKGNAYEARAWAKPAVARFGADAVPAVLNVVGIDAATNAELILPLADSRIAALAADWNARLKSVRPIAQAWLRRHPGVAARALVPAALDKAGKPRQAAEGALRFLAAEGFVAEVREAAAGYGAAAEAGIAVLLSVDPLYAALPKTMPELPAWAEPQTLPQLLVAGRERALPPDAARNVVRMLTISPPDAPYPGLAAVHELCDARSLAAFAWGLFENWRTAEHPPKQSFAFDALRWFGDDDVVRRLSPLIRAWPGEGGHARAVTGLDVLAAIGGDTALIHLYGISQKVKFKGLKETARGRIAAIARDLRLTREQLADRLVPDLGLDGNGALELDYGPRRFTVFFDEQLKPGVTDEAGKRLKALPKPGVKDDAELAPAAYQRFTGLKKDVRTLAADQIARLELAMVTRRRWTGAEFEEYLVGHPLLRHLVRRLVWADYGPGGSAPRVAFRVAEDLSYADVGDDPCTLPADAAIGVAHPVDLAGDLPRWSELFADYEILQPFQQLGRSVFVLTEQEAADRSLRRFDGLKTPAGKVLGLERRGWYRSDPADAGWQGHMLRDLAGGLTVVVDLDPGFGAGWAGQADDQQFQEVWIGQTQHGYTGYWRHHREAGSPFSVLDPVTASEVLRDLTEVTAP
ncbi:hypothetical protein GCM10009838_29960 [Catenulispora subtropica]|uniref:DUF4132 domain-containing protein n=1 Tax=Catenulispora subtropica TaxID=450798 RepID=A0ABP5CXC1_9ACTN